jgi:hypothetical protein
MTDAPSSHADTYSFVLFFFLLPDSVHRILAYRSTPGYDKKKETP